MKLCIDCRHYTPNPDFPNDAQKGLCKALEGSRSPIDGQYIAYPYLSCFNARSTGCGQSGRLWESPDTIQNTNPENIVILPNGLGVAYE